MVHSHVSVSGMPYINEERETRLVSSCKVIRSVSDGALVLVVFEVYGAFL